MGKDGKKTRRLVSQDGESLINEAKSMCASRAKRGINSLFCISRQMSSTFPEIMASAYITDEQHK